MCKVPVTGLLKNLVIVVIPLMLFQCPRVSCGELALLALVKRYLNEGVLSLHHNVASVGTLDVAAQVWHGLRDEGTQTTLGRLRELDTNHFEG